MSMQQVSPSSLLCLILSVKHILLSDHRHQHNKTIDQLSTIFSQVNIPVLLKVKTSEYHSRSIIYLSSIRSADNVYISVERILHRIHA